MKNRWTGADTPSLEGCVAIDTGASSGVGYEIASKVSEVASRILEGKIRGCVVVDVNL
jgi:hypothetical protein